MKEKGWVACKDVKAMLDYLRDKASNRKLRLLAVACCRGNWSALYEERCRSLLRVAERYADGLASRAELNAARTLAYPIGLIGTLEPSAFEAASRCSGYWDPAMRREASAPDRIREVFGNPFRKIAMDPAWLVWDGGSVLRVAERIYEEECIGDLPILADALEEAGCDETELLSHFREPGEHVRGCWALDLVLGKI